MVTWQDLNIWGDVGFNIHLYNFSPLKITSSHLSWCPSIVYWRGRVQPDQKWQSSTTPIYVSLPQFDQFCIRSTAWLRSIILHPKPRIERLSESGFYFVEQSHVCTTDAIKGQSTCLIIQVNSDRGGSFAWHWCASTIVSERVTFLGAVQTPRLVVISKLWVICGLLTDVFVWHGHRPGATTPSDLPVTSPWQTLAAQHLPDIISVINPPM